MSFSIQTNVNSLVAQNNLRVNQNFQGQTIQRLTSGYRINSSGDDAAGLSIANQYRSDASELTQGVRNANDGVSQLQIVDGGLSNISTMLDRMKTLATQSASGTFTGSRATLQTEYGQLISEITRQASDVGLNSGGVLNKDLSVYIGGSRTSTQAGSGSVDINLSNGSVDSLSLGISGTSVLGGSSGVDMALGSGGRLDNPGTMFLTATAVSASQDFSFNYADTSGNLQQRTVSVQSPSDGTGMTGTAVLAALNSGLSGTGILASVDSTNGKLEFSSAQAFTAYAGTPVGTGAGASIANATDTQVNTSLYNATVAAPAVVVGTSEVFTVSDGTNSRVVTVSAGDLSKSAMVADINAQLASGHDPNNVAAKVNVTALLSNNGVGISFQSSGNFNITESAKAGTSGGVFAAVGAQTVVAPAANATAGTAAQAAILAINAAVSALGTVQGLVGAGENKLNYAINLAQSQISNFDAAQSQLRDADVAAEASNLTKAQVLTQSSIAAMAQANSAPQAVLTLLRG